MHKVIEKDWESEDAIDLLSSTDQNMPQYDSTLYRSGTRKDLYPYYSILGLDTEMLIKVNGKTLWPHEEKLPQERVPGDLYTSGGSNLFDFHGDGFAIELCVAPTHCLEYMMRHVEEGLNWFNKKEKQRRSDPEALVELDAPALYEVPRPIVDAAPPDVKRLGCMPSLNIYGNPGDPGYLKDNARTTGCHLHLSHPTLLKGDVTPSALIRWADLLVGCAWTYISPEDPDNERERRKAYGRAGEHRLKEYPVYPKGVVSETYFKGVEYRVLPGTVLTHPAYLTLMFSLYRVALRMAFTYKEPTYKISNLAQAAINDVDKELAFSILESLPFTPASKGLINMLHAKSIKLKTLTEWVKLGNQCQGHQALADPTHNGHVLGHISPTRPVIPTYN